MNKQLAFYFDASRCMGCKACVIACKDANELPIGINWRHVVECSDGEWVVHQDGTYSQNVFAYYLSVACNHCEDPACVKACPTGAMHKTEDGIVKVDDSRCIGCNNCAWNCPYSAPQLNLQKKHMTKCDFCHARLEQGQPPLCVASCPARALDFGPREELVAKYGRANVAPLPPADITKPNLVINAHRDAKPAKAKKPYLANKEEISS